MTRDSDDYLISVDELEGIHRAGHRAYEEGRLKVPGETDGANHRLGVEELAEFAHRQWSGWNEYLFSKCRMQINHEGEREYVIPSWAVERWTRQMNTPYAELPEEEKASDRTEAYKALAVFDKLEAGKS